MLGALCSVPGLAGSGFELEIGFEFGFGVLGLHFPLVCGSGAKSGFNILTPTAVCVCLCVCVRDNANAAAAAAAAVAIWGRGSITRTSVYDATVLQHFLLIASS